MPKTDIVERLRLLESGARWMCNETAGTLEDAADEIERLREEGAEAAVMSNRANDRATALQMEVYYLKAEIERLRIEVEKLAHAAASQRGKCNRLNDERVRLREALRQIAEMGAPAECERIAREALAAKPSPRRSPAMSDIVDAIYEHVHVLLGPEQGKRMAAFIEARETEARREAIEAAAAVASKRAASRHSTVAHCHSDRSKKHMQIRADEAGQLVADIRALLEDGR